MTDSLIFDLLNCKFGVFTVWWWRCRFVFSLTGVDLHHMKWFLLLLCSSVNFVLGLSDLHSVIVGSRYPPSLMHTEKEKQEEKVM